MNFSTIEHISLLRIAIALKDLSGKWETTVAQNVRVSKVTYFALPSLKHIATNDPFVLHMPGDSW